MKTRHLEKLFTMMAVIVTGMLLTGCQKYSSTAATYTKSSNFIPKTTVASSANIITSGVQSNPLGSTNAARSFIVRGLIRELPADGRTAVVRHEEIPGFMAKMTMTFDVRDTNELRGLSVGDAITFRLKVNDEESWIEDVQRAGTNGLAASPPSTPTLASLLQIDQLKPGDVLPDAEFLAEDGRTIRLSEFQGRALAFTFIFTRCPLPDFCPRMNQHFSRARELLLQQVGGPTNWQFLSISFNPEFDWPEVLTRYANGYRGNSADRWLFAAASTNVMASMASQLDFRFADQGGNFLHNLRTVVLDRQRRLYRQFDGNKWKAEELAQALVEAATRKEQ